MKKIIILTAVLFLSADIYSYNKDTAKASINKAEIEAVAVDKLEGLTDFIPYKLYTEAVINLITAKGLFNEKKYSESHYLASISAIQFKSAGIKASAVKEKVSAGGRKTASKEPSRGITPSTTDEEFDTSGGDPIIRAGLVKKGPVYTSNISDINMFYANSFKIHHAGKRSTAKIIDVMTAYPDCKLTIVGHTCKIDTSGTSLRKAISVRNYLVKMGIKRGRISANGASNREVMHTPHGYKRVDRVEFIITQISE